MANIHVLQSSGNHIRLVLHIAIPATNNTVGTPWRTAVVRAKGGTTVLPDGTGTQGTISAAEKADIVSGAVHEAVVNMKRSTATNAALDAFYARIQSEILASLQAELEFYGHTR